MDPYTYMRLHENHCFCGLCCLNLPGTTRWLRCPIATVWLWSAQTVAGHWDDGIKNLRCKTAKLKCTKTTHTVPQTLGCNQHICNRFLPKVGKTCANAKAFPSLWKENMTNKLFPQAKWKSRCRSACDMFSKSGGFQVLSGYPIAMTLLALYHDASSLIFVMKALRKL